MEKMIARLQTVKTSQLKEMAVLLNEDFSNEATIVSNAVLDVLMARLPEEEFVEFCDSL